MEVATLENKIEVMVNYACEFIKTPFVWGGDDFSGFDCSGFIQEVLASVGLDPKGDQTAQKLYDTLSKQWQQITTARRGALVFFGKSLSEITHVAVMYDRHHMIEAGAGGKRTLTIGDAIKQNAFVRMRPLNNRSDLLTILFPME